jgi:outer membrane protein OmpA-like peptidoglycan-associated protein
MKTVLNKWAATAMIGALLTGCASTAPVGSTSTTSGGIDRNTAIGAGSGAALGGAIGAAVSSKGNKNEGALIGAAIGGVLGGVIGNQYGTQIKNQVGRLGDILRGTGSTATQMPDGSLKINLAGDLSFNSGSASIRESFVETLDKVAKVIAENPNSRVMVVGHTDSTGNADANQRLSVARANSVRDFLVTSGVSSSRITTYGRGSTQPVASNDTETGRAQNRRVEVFVFPNN